MFCPNIPVLCEPDSFQVYLSLTIIILVLIKSGFLTIWQLRKKVKYKDPKVDDKTTIPKKKTLTDNIITKRKGKIKTKFKCIHIILLGRTIIRKGLNHINALLYQSSSPGRIYCFSLKQYHRPHTIAPRYTCLTGLLHVVNVVDT